MSKNIIFYSVNVLFLAVTVQSLTCRPGEYMVNQECCPMCPSGSVVKNHCTSKTSTECVPCISPTYMDHPNGETKCFKCKICDSGAGLITKTPCGYTSNTVCECKPGLFCPKVDSNECDLCQKYTECQRGEQIKKLGTASTDVECEECPFGYFSNLTSSKNCTPWTRCSDQGLIENKPGTSTSDAICTEKRKRFFYIPVGTVAGVVSLYICVIIFKHKKQKKTDIPKHSDDMKFPIADTGAQMSALEE